MGVCSSKENVGNEIEEEIEIDIANEEEFALFKMERERILSKDKEMVNNLSLSHPVTLSLSNQGEYVGNIKDKLGNGYGEMRNQQWMLQGNWKDGYPDGYIKFNTFQNEEIEGTFINGKLEGNGEFKSKNGGKYKGQMKNNLMNGQGRYEWPDGSYYVGEFLNGVIHGKGIYNYANGTIYEGEFKNGKKDGKGVMSSKKLQGKVRGTWREGLLENDLVLSN